MKLEDIKPCGPILEVLLSKSVQVMWVKYLGQDPSILAYKTFEDQIFNTQLCPVDENRLVLIQSRSPWSFDGEGADILSSFKNPTYTNHI